jgi:hypothetical protein
MSYDIQKLRGNEIIVFKEMIRKYMGFDKIDLLVHKTLKCVGTSKDDFLSREVKQKKQEVVFVIQNEADELNKFCDGGKCELPILPKEKC